MHKKAMECAKKTLEEFCALGEPTCEQAEFFCDTMTGLYKFIASEKDYEIIEKMKEADEEEKLMSKMGMDERMGYTRKRDSMGRFRHYRPYLYKDEDEYMDEYMDNPAVFERNMRMGYHGSYGPGGGGTRTGMNGGNRMYNADPMMMQDENRSKYNKSYDDYRAYRRHYEADGDPEKMMKMKTKMSEIFDDMEDMAIDIVKDMTPEEREKYRMKIINLSQKFE